MSNANLKEPPHFQRDDGTLIAGHPGPTPAPTAAPLVRVRYVMACHAYMDNVRDYGSQEFAKAFTKALRE